MRKNSKIIAPEPRPGQIWKDLYGEQGPPEYRFDRYVRILEVPEGTHVISQTVIKGPDGSWQPAPRSSRLAIRKDRLRPVTGGYRPIEGPGITSSPTPVRWRPME